MADHAQGPGAKRTFRVSNPGAEPLTITIGGCDRWALERLMAAGAEGCSPYNEPAPRWSEYVRRPRHGLGVSINTERERHGGPYAGTHGLYILTADVERVPAQVKP